MRWYYYVAYFFGGAFIANFVPHFVNGISGNPFQSPFASPPGQGLSSSTVNVLWWLLNLLIGYLPIGRVGKLASLLYGSIYAGQPTEERGWDRGRSYMCTVSLRRRVKESRAHELGYATFALGHEDVLPVGDGLSRKWPQVLRKGAELVVVDRHVQPALGQRHRRSPQFGLVVDGVDPEIGQVDVRVPEHL